MTRHAACREMAVATGGILHNLQTAEASVPSPLRMTYNAGRYCSKDNCAKPPIEPRNAICPEDDFCCLLCALH